MEGLVTSWVLAPVGLVLVVCGLSMMAEAVTGQWLPWTLRPALGMAVMIVLAQIGTMSAAVAGLTLPLIALLGLVGWAVAIARKGLGPVRGTGLLIGLAVFALYALPFFVRGEATWAGYIKLDDTATFMAMADWAFEHGRGAPNTALGSFTVTIQDNLGAGYPIGSFVAAAMMGAFPGQDIAWTIQPGMALGACFLAMVLYELGRLLLGRPGAAAVAALGGCLSALFVGYYLWGGVKELAAAPLIALGPAVVAAVGASADTRSVRNQAGDSPSGPAPIQPSGVALGALLGIVAAALIGSLGLGAGVWIGPIYLLLLVVIRRQGGQAGRVALTGGGLTLLLGLPAVITPAGFFNPLQDGLTSESELGNLAEPLNLSQVAGIWPALDFRQTPGAEGLVAATIALVLAAAVWAVWRSRSGEEGGAGGFAALMVGGLVATLVTVLVASPWVGAKALATYSPILLFAGISGLVLLARELAGGALRKLSYGLIALVFGMAVWGAMEAYSGISFTPRDHYEELERIAERFDGQGPALSTEVSVSGPRHFLRRLDANSAGGRRAFQVLTRDGEPHPPGVYLDISEIRPDQLREFALIVTRRSPVSSRPPSEFRLVWLGKFYEVWERRPDDGTHLVQDLRIGGPQDRGGVLACGQIEGLAQMAGPDGELRAAPAGEAPLVLDVREASMPAEWQALGPDTFSPLSRGSMTADLSVDRAGRYRLWVGGEVYGGLTVMLDGEKIAELRGAVDNGGGFTPFDIVPLEAGEHRIEVHYSGRDLHPGSGFQGTWSPFPVGPIVLAPESDLEGHVDPATGIPIDVAQPVTVRPRHFRNLCGRRLDWIEARTSGQTA